MVFEILFNTRFLRRFNLYHSVYYGRSSFDVVVSVLYEPGNFRGDLVYGLIAAGILALGILLYFIYIRSRKEGLSIKQTQKSQSITSRTAEGKIFIQRGKLDDKDAELEVVHVEPEILCKNCSSEIETDSSFCPECGEKIS